jgi:glutamate-1-semialdehyde 2,1-aminomutase
MGGFRLMGYSQDLYAKAKTLIPGGTQLLSKRPEMFLPGAWPSYYSKAKGCKVWDLDGHEYTDMSYMGIGANILGYADEDVDCAAIEAIQKSAMCTLNAPEEVELAEKLISIHPWADMVRYAKTGGEAACISIRLARAKTKKDVVLFCGYHGWHDWYLAGNLGETDSLAGHLLPGLSPNGVPKALRGTSFPFSYNDVDSFDQLMLQHRGKIAAVIMEPLRNEHPNPGFLEHIRRKTIENGVVLIFDEISAGFRLCLGGAHLLFGVTPDVAIFGKALSNGYPMAAVIGQREVMNAAQDSFISSTYWTDRIGLKAALATIKKYHDNKVDIVLKSNGKKIQDGWQELAKKHGLEITITGIEPLSTFKFNYSEALKIRTIFIQEMLKRKFLATTGYYASYAHKESDIKDYLVAVDESFKLISAAVSNNNLDEILEGSVCHSGFKRLA